MVISPHLYVGKSLEGKQDKILKKLLRNRKILQLFIITNASNDENLFDIHYYNELFQKYYRNHLELTVYGIAKTRSEAFALVEEMVQDCLTVQNDCNLRDFMGLPKGHKMGG
ncbi:MAG: hypothetical protein PUC39_09820 [Lachnospiraceae bacterium]|nr:hypothetical protein [Lachnospiraceae bacterium]